VISFIHEGGRGMASFRYRCEAPARALGALINDLNADTLIFSKPTEANRLLAADAILAGKKVIVDFCDDHFVRSKHYRTIAHMVHGITCPTEVMRLVLASMGLDARVIPDPYLYEERQPHCGGHNLLWFGHAVNIESIRRLIPSLNPRWPLRVVSNSPDTIRWSEEVLEAEMKHADIVILPATAAYKSNNRALEAIRRGCFVVAEPHPSLAGIPIYVGNIPDGIEWALRDLKRANFRTRDAQHFIRESYSPQTTADAWRTAITAFASMPAAANTDGLDGRISILDKAISVPIYEDFRSRKSPPPLLQPSTYLSTSISGKPRGYCPTGEEF
jgi:hypothetical protein